MKGFNSVFVRGKTVLNVFIFYKIHVLDYDNVGLSTCLRFYFSQMINGAFPVSA